MTDELNRQMSQFMGECWHEPIELKKEWGGMFICKHCDAVRFPKAPNPDFSHEIAQAWRLVEKARELGYWFCYRSPFGAATSERGSIRHKHFAGFTPLEMSGWNGRPDYEASGDTAPLAICLAVKKLEVRDAETEPARD